MVTVQEMLAATAAHQAWRSEADTLRLAIDMAERAIPFCVTCGDWHFSDESHSWTDQDNV